MPIAKALGRAKEVFDPSFGMVVATLGLAMDLDFLFLLWVVVDELAFNRLAALAAAGRRYDQCRHMPQEVRESIREEDVGMCNIFWPPTGEIKWSSIVQAAWAT